MPFEALSIGKPCLEFVGVVNIENPISGDLGAHRNGRGVDVELEVGYRVGVGGEDDLAPLINCETGEVGVEVLAPGEAVDLDRDSGIGAGRENFLPPRLESRTMMEVAAARVGEDVHAGGLNGTYEALGLIAVGVEVAVNRGHHALHLEPFPLGHIEGAVSEDLNLETLEHMVVLPILAVPSRDPLLLQTNPLEVETGGDLEPARVVGDHRPGVTTPPAGAGHGLEGCLAVGVPGMPVKGASHPFRMEVRGAGTQGLGHLGTTQIALPGGPPPRRSHAFEPLNSGFQGGRPVARGEL